MAMWLGVESTPGNISRFSSITSELDLALRNAVQKGLNIYNDAFQPVRASQFAEGWLINGCPLNVYFTNQWAIGQQDALRAGGITECLPVSVQSPSVKTTTAPTAGPIVAPPPGSVGTTGTATYTGTGIKPGGGTTVEETTTIIAGGGPSLTPGTAFPTSTGTVPKQGIIYRFFVESKRNGRIDYDSGANYPACSRSNPEGCDPKQFTSLSDLQKYAQSKGEKVVRGDSAEDVWNMIEGNTTIDPKKIIQAGIGGMGVLAIMGIGFFLLKGRKKT